MRKHQDDEERKQSRKNLIHLYDAILAGNVAGVADALTKVGANDTLAAGIGGNHDSPIQHAARHGNKAIAELLLNAGADKDECGGDGRDGGTPLCHAARNGHADVVQLLIERGADMSIRDRNNNTPLRIAINKGNEQIVLLFVNGGAPFADTEELCLTAMMSVDMVHALLARQIRLCEVRDHLERTLCHIAADRGVNSEVFTALLHVATVDVNARDCGYRTCVFICATFDFDALRVCIEAGADIELPFVYGGGLTPLHNACSVGNYQSTLYLLAAGAALQTTNMSGRTALHFAADSLENGNLKVFYLMLAAGADADVVDNDGKSPRALAQALGVPMPSEGELECHRREIVATQLDFVRKRAFDVCVGLQSRELDALQLCEILRHACGPVASTVPFHLWWKIATTIKHFRD
jgi:ankyrin repeat protein